MPHVIERTQKSHHGTWLEIHLNHLDANLNALLRQSLPGTEALAVVKANAYGHGLLEISRRLENQVCFLGVTSLLEAIELKERGITTPIFVFSPLLPDELPPAVSHDLVLSLSSLREAQDLSEAAQAQDKVIRAHVKVDTGMGRLGLPYGQALASIEKMASLPGLELEGIFTHFPTAEAEDGFAERQVADFGLLLQALEKKGITFRYRHGANSAGSVKIHTPLFNMIRPGLMLYGLYPEPRLAEAIHLSPVLSLKSRILSLKRLMPGESAGYGRQFIAERPTTIAILPMGYSHGYPVQASGRAEVLFRGQRFPLAGRVSMDYLAVNLGDQHARLGEEVTLIGTNGEARIRAEDLADWAGTIPYEIVTRLVARLPRFYY